MQPSGGSRGEEPRRAALENLHRNVGNRPDIAGSGFDVREIGGPRGYERGDYRPQREYFAVICSTCGNAAQVPFKPRQDKPVYCSDCFRDVQAAS